MQIREMKSEELDDVLELHLEGLKDEIDLLNLIVPGKQVDLTGRVQLKKTIYQMLHLAECNIFIARTEKEILGYCLATKRVYPVENPKICGCINGIYIKPDARKQKLGSQLFDLAVSWFKSQRVSYVELYHMLNDERAKEFWKKMGFSPIQYNCVKYI